jgi:hypothetical protein
VRFDGPPELLNLTVVMILRMVYLPIVVQAHRLLLERLRVLDDVEKGRIKARLRGW